MLQGLRLDIQLAQTLFEKVIVQIRRAIAGFPAHRVFNVIYKMPRTLLTQYFVLVFLGALVIKISQLKTCD